MERIVHDLVQGSPEWDQFRLTHDGASEIAAVLGLAKKTTRTELLHKKATGQAKEFSDWLQENVLDRGHEIEALVRPWAVEFAGVDGFYPATVSIGRISASCDGLDMLDEAAMEVKSLNKEYEPIVRAGRVPDEHMPQCQQVLLVTGADRLLFVMSDGTRENTFFVWVEPDTDWFDRIRAAWKQFNIDLQTYVPAMAVPPVVATPQSSLPALMLRVDGALSIVSNLPVMAIALRAYIERIPADPGTEQQFADCDAACKALKNFEDALDAGEEGALAQIVDVEQMRREKKDLYVLSRTTRLAMEKLVETNKKNIKLRIQQDAAKECSDFTAALNQTIGRPYMPVVSIDVPGAMARLKNVDSMRNAVSTAVANWKIACNDICGKIVINMATLRELAQPYASLFPDTAQIVLKTPEDCSALIENRITAHKQAEEKRLAAERERIAEEERVKAEAKARRELAEQQEREVAQRKQDEATARAAAPAATQVAESTLQAPASIPATVSAIPGKLGQQFGEVFTGRSPVAAVASSPPTLRLGQIAERLGFALPEAFIRESLGILPASKERGSVLFHEHQWLPICAALVHHVNSVCELQAA